MISSWHPHPSPNRRFSGRIECVDRTISRGESPISLSAYPELTLSNKNANTATLAYNANNQVTSITDATGRVLTLGWDTANPRINSVTDPAGRTWNLAYDAAGNLVSVTDPAAITGGTRFVTGYAYDADNRITTITDRRGKAWTFGYNTAGKLAWEKTPLLHQTNYTYGSSTATDRKSVV